MPGEGLEPGPLEGETGEEGAPVEGIPPAEPLDGGASGAGGAGGAAGGLSSGGLAEPESSSPLRIAVPFVSIPDGDPLMYVATWLDTQGENRAAYVGLSRSQQVHQYLLRLVLEDIDRNLKGSRYDGLLNVLGDSMQRVMRRAARSAWTELYDTARQDVITTLVERGVMSQERLESILGVGSGAVP